MSRKPMLKADIRLKNMAARSTRNSRRSQSNSTLALVKRLYDESLRTGADPVRSLQYYSLTFADSALFRNHMLSRFSLATASAHVSTA